MKKLMRLLLAVATLMALIALPTPAMAATLTVDDNGVECPSPDYNTIQAAVTAADPNDTIQVCAGTYNESVTITEPLTLLGPNAGISWDGGRGPEAIVGSPAFPFITFSVSPGDGVTIDGFTINGDFGIYVQGSSDNTLIQNNIVTGGIRALTLDGTLVTTASNNARVLNNHLISNIRSFHVDGPYTNMEVSGNRFSGLAASAGIFFTAGCCGLNNAIAGFEFTDNEVLHPANMASNISNATVSGNTFDPALPGDEALLINLHNATVTDNIFEGDDQIACLGLWGSQFTIVPSDHVTISDNTFSDCGTASPSGNYAIQLGPDVHHIDITNNEISNGVEGVNTEDSTPWDVTNEIHINFNNITENTSFGVRNGQMGVLDAECNWWGAADGPGPVGPGTGDNVSTNVDYEPWLVAPAPGGPCTGRTPSTPGKVTGGGQVEGQDPLFSPLGELLSLPAIILSPNGSRANFGFVIQFTSGASAPKGNLMYQDHDADVTIKAISYDQLLISDTAACGPDSHATFTGMAKVNGVSESLTVEVDDCGEPSSGPPPDTFSIETDTYSNSGPLIGGNIQIR